ncbi:DDE-type integrase/transposase/recombinase [Listeria rocourtiae]|uniref:Mu transposase C-terminal domain-containing protein n=1 Tax=Listeria rocourtiae TaxID=647910 RepID=UPI001624690F|nr:Mu transposase C-terminal domain-containing protein [Listeria rocourtiae]MBC1433811.1 DDE-type integrase/transposase/recombinase [Listeria rocourtiae]
MRTRKDVLADFSNEKRQKAMGKYFLIEPCLMQQESLTGISKQQNIPLRTLQRWKKDYETDGLVGLIHQSRSDAGKIRIDESILLEIEHLLLQHKKMSIATIHRKICSYCEEKGNTSPSYGQVYRFVKSIPLSLVKLAHHGEKAYKEKYELIYTRESTRPNEIWQADHTLLDILVTDEKGYPNRPWLTVILDDYSRAIAGYYLSFSAPNATNTALTLHQAIWNKKDLDWPICGIPETFYTDHGSDFTSNYMEQVAVDLRINLTFSTIGIPRGRGKIERFFLTVNQLLLESLPGYVGSGINEDLLSIQAFKEKSHHFLIVEYNHRVHSSIHASPVKKWDDANFLPNMPSSLEELDLLLLEIPKTRKVHSDGIHFQGLHYINPNLTAFVGESVLIRYNPTDLAEIRVFYKNKFLCNAISPTIADYSVDLKDLISARNKRKHILKDELKSPSSVDLLIAEKQKEYQKTEKEKKSGLKRYYNE